MKSNVQPHEMSFQARKELESMASTSELPFATQFPELASSQLRPLQDAKYSHDILPPDRDALPIQTVQIPGETSKKDRLNRQGE